MCVHLFWVISSKKERDWQPRKKRHLGRPFDFGRVDLDSAFFLCMSLMNFLWFSNPLFPSTQFTQADKPDNTYEQHQSTPDMRRM